MTFTWSRYTVILLAALLALTGAPAWAADEPPPPNTGALSFTGVFNIPTSYYFRGIAQSNAGFQFQPYLELKVNLYEGGEKDVLTGGYVKAASFSHFQSVAAPIGTNYYEQDLYLTGGLVFFKRWTLEGGWNLYAYPGIGSAAQVQEVFGKVGVDDSGVWPFKLPGGQDFALSPYMLVAGETSGGADGASPYGGKRGIYLEFGIDPGYAVDFSKNWSARSISPSSWGSASMVYTCVATTTGVTDKTLRFARSRVRRRRPWRLVPSARYGKWTFSGGPHLLWLGSNNKLLAGPPNANALNGLNVTGGKGFEVWAVAGVEVEY